MALRAVAAGMLLAGRRLGAFAVALAVALAAARVYVGAHFHGDVAAGLALGAVVVLLGGLAAVPALRALAGPSSPRRCALWSVPGSAERSASFPITAGVIGTSSGADR